MKNLELFNLSGIIFFTAILLLLSGCTLSFLSSNNCNTENKDITVKQGVTANLTVYRSNKDKFSEKSIVIFPPTGGTNYIDKKYAEKFCRGNYDVYVLNNWTNADVDGIDLTYHEKNYERVQEVLTVLLDSITSPYIGMLGTSLGGLHTAVAIQKQPRLNSAFLIVAGGPIVDVIMTSDQKAMIKLRKDRKEILPYKTDAELTAALDKEFPIEPIKQGENYKSKRIGMSLALQDDTVPTNLQIKLKEFFKPDLVIEHNSSHFWGILKTWLYDDSKILDFFNNSKAN